MIFVVFIPTQEAYQHLTLLTEDTFFGIMLNTEADVLLDEFFFSLDEDLKGFCYLVLLYIVAFKDSRLARWAGTVGVAPSFNARLTCHLGTLGAAHWIL